MYLFILESIGTAELLLVGLVALIVFGPRKLPEMMRKAGKLMSEFRKTTGEFKESWEKEVAGSFEEERKLISEDFVEKERKIVENSNGKESDLTPEIKDLNQDEFELKFPKEKIQTLKKEKVEENINVKDEKEVIIIEEEINDKTNWL